MFSKNIGAKPFYPIRNFSAAAYLRHSAISLDRDVYERSLAQVSDFTDYVATPKTKRALIYRPKNASALLSSNLVDKEGKRIEHKTFLGPIKRSTISDLILNCQNVDELKHVQKYFLVLAKKYKVEKVKDHVLKDYHFLNYLVMCSNFGITSQGINFIYLNNLLFSKFYTAKCVSFYHCLNMVKMNFFKKNGFKQEPKLFEKKLLTPIIKLQATKKQLCEEYLTKTNPLTGLSYIASIINFSDIDSQLLKERVSLAAQIELSSVKVADLKDKIGALKSEDEIENFVERYKFDYFIYKSISAQFEKNNYEGLKQNVDALFGEFIKDYESVLQKSNTESLYLHLNKLGDVKVEEKVESEAEAESETKSESEKTA